MIRRSNGFSMIELMVSITLGLLVTGAVISVFVGSRSAYQSTAGTAAVADGGRFALDLLQASARSSGFLACGHSNTTAASGQNLLNVAGFPLQYDFANALTGYESTGTGPGGTLTLPAAPTANSAKSNWTPQLDTSFGSTTTQQVTGSDVIVLRSSAPRMTSAYTSGTVTAGSNTFQAYNATGLQSNQVAVISDCVNWFTFQVGAVTSGNPATITLAGANSGPLPLSFAAGAVVTPVTTAVYYVGVGSDGDSALRRMELVNGATAFTDEELVPDIENMQVLYGVVDATGRRYVTANNVAAFNSVASIKIAVLAASPIGSGKLPTTAPTYNLLGTLVTAPKDTRLRKVFTVTIGLRDALT